MATKSATPEKKREATVLVGCDDGHDTIKLAFFDPDDVGKGIQYQATPAKASMGANLINLDGSQGANSYRVDNILYTISSMVTGDIVDTRSQGTQYPTSALNLVFVQDALMRAGLDGRKINLVTGLPVRDYYAKGTINQELIDAKKANLSRKDLVAMGSEIELSLIEDQRVACEALATVYDMVLNEDGSDNDEFYETAKNGPIGVADLGGKTLDLCVAQTESDRIQVNMQRAQSFDVGMMEAMDTLELELKKKYGQGSIAPAVLQRAMVEGKIRRFGKDEDVSDLVKIAINAIAPKYISAIHSCIGNGADLSHLTIVGGGSYLLFDHIKAHYPHAIRPEQPEFANARGMLKLARLSMGAKAA